MKQLGVYDSFDKVYYWCGCRYGGPEIKRDSVYVDYVCIYYFCTTAYLNLVSPFSNFNISLHY